MKNSLILLFIIALFAVSCGGGDTQPNDNKVKASGAESNNNSNDPPSYDPNRGIGKYTDVELSDKLDKTLADAGEKIAGVKCLSCHKLTDERLVGPGWKGVTERRTPEWLMNFFTNPDPNLDQDPELQAQLEICLVRMPNQDVADTEAREILEFMRKNDGVQ